VDLDGDNEGLSSAPFPEFAARLVRTIQAAQPHGPYYLGGWCVSGLLAYEVAAQLIEAGEKVGLVVMLDAPNPAHFFKIPKFRLLTSKAAYHLKRLLRTQIGDVFPYAWKRTQGFVRQLLDRRPEAPNPFQTALDRAVVSYEPKAISARVLAVQPKDHPAVWDLRESWAPHITQGNFEIRESPGNHLTMFEEPHTAALAACIRKSLRDNVVEIRRAVAG
jgi:thioesterase domain-containing protein